MDEYGYTQVPIELGKVIGWNLLNFSHNMWKKKPTKNKVIIIIKNIIKESLRVNNMNYII